MIEHFKLKCFFSYNGSMKILFLDIDGTVLSHTTNTIPSSALKAINTVRKQGIKVFGCTGRHTLELEKLPLEHLKVDGWITMNGAYNYTEFCVISSYPIEKQDIHALYDFLKEEQFPVQFLEAKYMYMNMHSSLVEKSLEKIHSKQDPIAPLERILENNIYMFIPWVEQEIYDQISFENVKEVRWNAYAVDCFHKECGKKHGITDVLNYYGISKEDSCSVGDGENDISMFEACGKNVAMGNAVDSLKQRADYITSDIDAGGLEEAIKFLVK